MSEQSEAIVPTAPSSSAQRSNLLVGVRQLAYAWVGMWGVASDDLGNFYNRCVAHGDQIMNAKPSAAHLPVKPQEDDVAVSQSRSAAFRRIRPMSIVNVFGAVESYHIDLNVDRELPTKTELDAVIESVEALSREVDALVEQRKQEQ